MIRLDIYIFQVTGKPETFWVLSKNAANIPFLFFSFIYRDFRRSAWKRKESISMFVFELAGGIFIMAGILSFAFGQEPAYMMWHNAFCHRDYTMLGSVRVLLDDEGLSISNPGGFVDGVNLKNLLTVEPHGRNPALADAMKRIGLAEKTGRGIDRIYEGSIVFGRPWPDYSESTSRTVKLFIQRARAELPFAKFVADEQNRQGKPLSIYTLMILSVMNTERRVTLDRIVDIMNLGENKVRKMKRQMLTLLNEWVSICLLTFLAISWMRIGKEMQSYSRKHFMGRRI